MTALLTGMIFGAVMLTGCETRYQSSTDIDPEMMTILVEARAEHAENLYIRGMGLPFHFDPRAVAPSAKLLRQAADLGHGEALYELQARSKGEMGAVNPAQPRKNAERAQMWREMREDLRRRPYINDKAQRDQHFREKYHYSKLAADLGHPVEQANIAHAYL